jgi:hypothetical protein
MRRTKGINHPTRAFGRAIDPGGASTAAADEEWASMAPVSLSAYTDKW